MSLDQTRQSPLIRQAALLMRDELMSNRLHVVKIKTGDGYIRVAIGQSPRWYSDLCREHERRRRKRYRRHRTIIKRCHTLRALERISAGRNGTVYAERLLPYVEDVARRLVEWGEEIAYTPWSDGSSTPADSPGESSRCFGSSESPGSSSG